jgi:hypothetical protein
MAGGHIHLTLLTDALEITATSAGSQVPKDTVIRGSVLLTEVDTIREGTPSI